jgi:NAD(P)-dependent dehydrogenase (short-subunit alcohol dehydrogenase family)
MVNALNKEVTVESLVGDVASEQFVQELITQCLSTFGQLNYAVNAAGISGVSKGTGEMEFEEYKQVQGVNTEGTWLCERAEIRAMLEQEPINGYALS